MKNNGDQNCCICRKALSKLKKKFSCSSCHRAICKYHMLISDSNVPVCEDCFSKEIEEDFAPETQRLEEELSKLRRVKEHYKEEIRSKNESLDRQTSLMESSERIHMQKVADLELRLSQESQRKTQLADINQNLRPALEQSKENLSKNQKRLEGLNRELENELDIQNLLNEELQKLIDMEEVLSYKQKNTYNAVKLRASLCRTCYHKLKVEFKDLLADAFKQQNRGSLLESVVAASCKREAATRDVITSKSCNGCCLM